MPEIVNTSFLGAEDTSLEDSSKATMISVDHVSMVFNMASENLTNLKEYAIAALRHELRFKEFRALDDVSLKVKQGDVFGILGTNGSGKSTLLKIVAGVLEPSSGTCESNGKIAPLIELGAGFDMELTARENIYLNGALLGYPKEFINEHFDEIVSFAEIKRFLDMPLKNYSSGMVARIAFAVATVMVPDILIVDEVLSVGDIMFQKKCERRIDSLINDFGVTVLIVSHNTDQIERLCNKAIWIEKGHVRTVGPAGRVCETYRMLGGQEGSAESEERVFSLIDEPTPEDTSVIETILGDNRYSVSAKIFDEIIREKPRDTIILSPGGNEAVGIIANSLSSVLDAPILLTQKERIPDYVSPRILNSPIKTIVVLGGKEFINDDVVEHASSLAPEAQIVRFLQNDEADIAYAVYQQYKDAFNNSKTAILTYREGLGDLLCFLPFIYKESVPVFYSADAGRIDKDVTASLCSGAFDRLLVLGGEDPFPESSLEPFKDSGIEVTRICGTSPYDANGIIMDWIKKNTTIMNDSFQPFFISIWNPVDALAIGPLLELRNGTVVVEDSQDLNSLAFSLDFISNHAKSIDKLVFVGDSSEFSDMKKTLHAKEFFHATKAGQSKAS